MPDSLFGQVIGVRKFATGDVEIDFFHDDKVTEFKYSSDPSRLGNLPKPLADSLASTLATNICSEIFFDNNGNLTHIELEECDDDDDEFDEDIVVEES